MKNFIYIFFIVLIVNSFVQAEQPVKRYPTSQEWGTLHKELARAEEFIKESGNQTLQADKKICDEFFRAEMIHFAQEQKNRVRMDKLYDMYAEQLLCLNKKIAVQKA